MITPFIPSELYVRVECDLKDDAGNLMYPGVWIEARKNLSIGERMALVDALDAIDDEQEQANDLLIERGEQLDLESSALDLETPEGRRAQRELLRRQKLLFREQRVMMQGMTSRKRDLIAPYIRAWNIHNADETPLAPPATEGVNVLDGVFPDLVQWMMGVVGSAYRMGKGLGTTMKSGDAQVPTQEPSNAGPQVINTSPSRRSRKK